MSAGRLRAANSGPGTPDGRPRPLRVPADHQVRCSDFEIFMPCPVTVSWVACSLVEIAVHENVR